MFDKYKCHQTCEIHSNRTGLAFYSLEEYPLPPKALWAKAANTTAVALKQADGAVKIWWSNGTAEEFKEDGTMRIWYPKPSIKEAVYQHPGGEFFQFFPDGTVEAFTHGKAYLWGKSTNNRVEEGVEILPTTSADGSTYFDIFGRKVWIDFKYPEYDMGYDVEEDEEEYEEEDA